jgi:hypothetical protein
MPYTNKSIAAALCLLVLLAVPAFGQFTPSDDAYVNAASATTNFGGAATLNLQSASQTTYIRFDLSPVPSSYTDAQVAKATLKLFVNSVTTSGSFNVDMVNGIWSERTVTYALQPAIGSTVASSVPLTTTNKSGYIQIDVTSAVQAWLSGSQENDGIALVANSPLAASFTTKENTNTSHPPELDIVFYGSGAQGPQGPAGPQGPQGAQGLQGPSGSTGPIGPAGPQGASGPAGINNRGTWSPITAYQLNDSVSYIGSSWIAILPSTNSAPNTTNPNWQLLAAKGINNQGSWVQTTNYQVGDAVSSGGQFWIAVAPSLGSQPSSTNSNWQLIAAAGKPGLQGPAGVAGPAGPAGANGATGPQGPAGAQGPAGSIGPVGPQGAQGPQGPPGPVGPGLINNRGSWDGGASYNVNDAVAYLGSYWLSLTTNQNSSPTIGSTDWQLMAEAGVSGAPGQKGDPGPAGSTGLQGPSGPPGVAGATGPQGPAGPQGSQGPAGQQGPAGPSGNGLREQKAALLRWYRQDFSANGAPGNIAFDGTNLWVTDFSSGSNSVTEMRASDGATLGTFPVGNHPTFATFDGANVWVTNQSDNTVTKLRASDGSTLGTFAVGKTPAGTAFDGANIWVANAVDNTVTKLRASDGANLGTFAAGSEPATLVFDGAKVWVVSASGSYVTELRASDGANLGSFLVAPNPFGIAFDGANIWVVSSSSSGFLTKLRASDGGLVLTVPNLGSALIGVVFDGTNVWVTNRLGNSVTEVRAADGVVVGTFSTGASPYGLAFDGANVWVANSGGGTVSRF